MGVNGLVLGYLFLRSGLVPRQIAMFGVVGGPPCFVGAIFVLFGAWEQTSSTQFADPRRHAIRLAF